LTHILKKCDILEVHGGDTSFLIQYEKRIKLKSRINNWITGKKMREKQIIQFSKSNWRRLLWSKLPAEIPHERELLMHGAVAILNSLFL